MACTNCYHCRELDELKDGLRNGGGIPDAIVSDTRDIALSNVSGALVDADHVRVPEDVTEYGEAVRQIVRERDEARADVSTLSRWNEDKARRLVALERERDEARAGLAAERGARLRADQWFCDRWHADHARIAGMHFDCIAWREKNLGRQRRGDRECAPGNSASI